MPTMPDVRLICENCSVKWFIDEAHQAAGVEPKAISCQACGGHLRHLLEEVVDLLGTHLPEPDTG